MTPNILYAINMFSARYIPASAWRRPCDKRTPFHGRHRDGMKLDGKIFIRNSFLGIDRHTHIPNIQIMRYGTEVQKILYTETLCPFRHCVLLMKCESGLHGDGRFDKAQGGGS
jgi:hypothetical protein